MFSPYLRNRKVDMSEKVLISRSTATWLCWRCVEVGIIYRPTAAKTTNIIFKNFQVYIDCKYPLSHLENYKN